MALSLASLAFLSACTWTQLHGTGTMASNFTHGEINSPLEAVFYAALSADLENLKDLPEAHHITADLSISETDIGLASTKIPIRNHQVIVSAAYALEREGTLLTSGTQYGRSGYQAIGIAQNDAEARDEAHRNAARLAGEAVSQAILVHLQP